MYLFSLSVYLTYYYEFDLTEDQEQYWQLMEAWFPENDPQPVCFIMQTREQAYIFEQGLKLCMIRSPVSQLVNAGERYALPLVS